MTEEFNRTEIGQFEETPAPDPEINRFSEICEPEALPGEAPGKVREGKRARRSLLRSLLPSSLRGGAAVMAALLTLAAVGGGAAGQSGAGAGVREITSRLQTDAVRTQKNGLRLSELRQLWQADPAGPHAYGGLTVISAPDCQHEGSAEEVCAECGLVHTVVLPASGHTPGDALPEQEVPADCIHTGHYEAVVSCQVCGAELSRTELTTAATGMHTPGDAVYENVTVTDCAEGGSCEEVICCAVCGAELSRAAKTVPAGEHTPGEPAEENRIDSSCAKAGSFDTVIVCSICGKELSRETTGLEKLPHTPGSEQKENVKNATCTSKSSYDLVIRCTECGELISRQTSTGPALGHSWSIPAGFDGPDVPVQRCSRCSTSALSGSLSLNIPQELTDIPTGTVSYSFNSSFVSHLQNNGYTLQYLEVIQYGSGDTWFIGGQERISTSGGTIWLVDMPIPGSQIQVVLDLARGEEYLQIGSPKLSVPNYTLPGDEPVAG